MAVDSFTKYVEDEALEGKTSAALARWFHLNIVARYGLPSAVRTDHGSKFAGDFEALLHALCVKRHYSSVAYPQSNV